MDSLTHLLVGHAMGAVAGGAAGAYGSAAYWAVLIGNSLPDIDVPISLIFRRDIKMHRTLTHTVPGCAALALATSVALIYAFPGTPLAVAFAWAFLGCLVHLGMDCLNLFGARPFWPVHPRSVEMGILHIIDPIVLILLGAPSLGTALGWTSKASLAVGFFGMCGYIGYRILTARRLLWQLRSAGSQRARLIPWYNSWRYVTETASGLEYGRWAHGQRSVMERFDRLEHPLIEASRQTEAVQIFLRSCEYPYAQLEESATGTCVVWGDALRRMRADFQPLRIPMM